MNFDMTAKTAIATTDTSAVSSVDVTEARGHIDRFIDANGFFIQSDAEFNADCLGNIHDLSNLNMNAPCHSKGDGKQTESIFCNVSKMANSFFVFEKFEAEEISLAAA